MIIRINGRELVTSPVATTASLNQVPQKSVLPKLKRILLPVTAGLSLLSRPSSVWAAAEPARGVADNLMPIIHMLQDFAFPVGLGIGIWGLIEYIMDNPAGKEKVKKAIIGYIGIFVLPSIFNAIRDAFGR